MIKIEHKEEQGQRMSFYQLIHENKYHIEIPMIQRDYAQGRKSYDEYRGNFLNKLKSYLDENKPNRDLDFIYGTIEKKEGLVCFIPLDGQQRLTTLFLLHWYLALKEGYMDTFREAMTWSENYISRFTYKTRTSSAEFFDALLMPENQIDLSSNVQESDEKSFMLSEVIKNCGWYFMSWEFDPTVQSVLVMIDAIHTIFKDCDNYYERLTSIGNPIITFMFLNIGHYGLTDDLYIKMNARGRPLTNYENFKARLEQEIKEMFKESKKTYHLLFNSEEKEVSVQKYFAHQIDTDWTNLFWQYRTAKNTIDDKILNFLNTIFINELAKNGLEDLVKKYRNAKKISFTDFKKSGVLKQHFILDLITLLDNLKNKGGKIESHLGDFFYYDERREFERCLDYKFENYNQRIQFYAYCQFLIKWESAEGLAEWMRVVHNLTANIIYNRESEFIRDINGVTALIPESKNIIGYLRSKPAIKGFNDKQIEEECIKAKLLDKPSWVEVIKKAEQHNYFTGQIGFLINFSGIEDYYNDNLHCDWTPNDNLNYLDQFKTYRNKAFSVFETSGLKKSIENYMWQRALLTKGEYLLKEGSNWSFLIDSDRDISWKRLLFDGGIKVFEDDNRQARRSYVKELFDDVRFNPTKINDSLERIIIESGQTIADWRWRFISNYALFDYLGQKKYIRWQNDKSIFLLSGERVSGRHAELYTYDLYLKLKADSSFDVAPFKTLDYRDVHSSEEKRCVYLQGFTYKKVRLKLCIYFNSENVEEIHQYKILLEKESNHRETKNLDELISVLNLDNKMHYNEDPYYLGYELHCKTENEVIKEVEYILEKIKTII